MDYKKLATFIEPIKDCVVVISNRGIIRLANTAVTGLLGYTEEDLIGNNVSMLMGIPHQAKHDSYIQNYQTTGVSQIIGKGREVVAVSKDGKKKPVRLNISEMESDGQVFYVGMLYDLSNHETIEEHIQAANTVLEKELSISNEKLSATVRALTQSKLKLEQKILETKLNNEKLKVAQQEVQGALKKEKELNDLKSRFISTASHEFRTPLSSILSSASLIERYTTTETNEKRLKHTNRIKSSVNNLTQILNDFLSLSKFEEGKIEAKKQLFDLGKLIEGVVEGISIATKQGQEIIYEHEGSSDMIHSNTQSIKNILLNLLSNAIKYSEKDKIIQIFTKLDNQNLTIRVKDEGMGIPEDEKHLMFSRFFRAENATNIQGTGLGLYIVKKYVEALQGSIDFESEQNIGTTFRIILPIQKM